MGTLAFASFVRFVPLLSSYLDGVVDLVWSTIAWLGVHLFGLLLDTSFKLSFDLIFCFFFSNYGLSSLVQPIQKGRTQHNQLCN